MSKKETVVAKQWDMTLNNYTQPEVDMIRLWEHEVTSGGCSFEVGSDGTKHIQGRFTFRQAKRFTTLQKMCPRGHWEPTNKAKDNTYILKADGSSNLWYVIAKRKGATNDKIRDLVVAGGNMRAISVETTSSSQIRYAESLLKYVERSRDFPPEIIWIYGPSGAGKTRLAVELCDDTPWWSGKNLQWWEGYDAHTCVIIDDFRRDFCTYHELLRILDRYPYRVEVKGGSRQLVARKMIVTSIFSHYEVYETREDLYQLTRRISRSIKLTR